MTREEFQEKCIIRRLKAGDSVLSFNCEDEDLNDFILNEASLYRNALLSDSAVNVDDVIETTNHFRAIDFIIEETNGKLTEAFIKLLQTAA